MRDWRDPETLMIDYACVRIEMELPFHSMEKLMSGSACLGS